MLSSYGNILGKGRIRISNDMGFEAMNCWPALMLDPMSLLDQPTSTLSAHEAEKLFAAIAELKRRGIAVLYVSHRMSETKQLCDRAIVLRNGEIVSEHHSPVDSNTIAMSILGDLILSTKHTIRRSQEKPCFVGNGLRVSPD